MENPNYQVDPDIIIKKLSSRIADMALQVAALEALVDSLGKQLSDKNQKDGIQNGLT